MNERFVEIATPDGPMSAFLAVPEGIAPCPAVIIYMDIFGPREELNDFCRRLAGDGFAAIMPQLFHRLGSPVFPPINRREDKADPGAMAANKATSMQHTLTDTRAILDALDDGLLGVEAGPVGVIGYCMGGRHAIAAAATHPDRIGAGLSLHGGRMVDDSDDPPQAYIAGVKAPFFIGFAENDATCPDDHQELIRELAAAAGPHIVCERFAAHHGWSFPERWCYNEEVAEQVHARSLDMFRAMALPG